MLSRRFCTYLLIILSISGMTACTKVSSPPPEDILTQTVISADKIPVTILVKNAFSIHNFEQTAEEKFPQLDIIQVGNYTSDMGTEEYAARLEHDDLTDIVMTWPLNVGKSYWEDRLMDLSSLPLTGKYNTAMLDNISEDGKLYYLPGPSQVRGIVYNKTLFEENGWQVPNDFDGFIKLCHTIEDSGIRSLQLGLGNEEVLDTAFVGFGNASCFSKPEDAQWMYDYNNGTGSFGDHFMPALDIFQTLIDEEVLRKEDLSIFYSEREQMLFTRQCAMVEDSVLLARQGKAITGTNDQFALMPFFNPGPVSDWARLYPVCYIGVNKKLGESKNKEKYDLTMQLLEYISTPEGQTALISDTGAMFSSLNGTEPPQVPEIKDLVPTLTQGRYTVFPTLKNAQGALRKGLAGMVEGVLTADDVCIMVDQENLNPPVKIEPSVLGSATEDFSLIETGNYITDVMRAETGSEIALFLDNGKDGRYNGKGVSARLYQGNITTADIKRVLPDLKYGETDELCKITMTGADLYNTLEYAIPVTNDNKGWFYYFSGLKAEFDPAAEPGQRIKKITDENDKEIDPDKIYTIAVMDHTVPEEFIKSYEKTGIMISDLLERAVQDAKTISPSYDARFKIS